MAWEVRTQMSTKGPVSDELEWSSVSVETQEEAEVWWNVRVRSLTPNRRVNTMMNPQGEVVRVSID